MKYLHDLKVQYLPVTGVKPDPRNARTHSRKQTEQIAASIGAFGFTNPLLIDEGAVLIAGHGRLAAARKLGLDRVPVIELRGLGETEKRALRLADNKIAQNAGWDGELLKIELEALAKLDLGFNLELTGFSSGEIDFTLGQGKVDPDDEIIPAVPVDARTRLGDIWQLGPHRVGCGDCRDPEFLQALLGPGIRADAAFLDPPYNVKINGHANARGRHREFAMASGEMSEAEFQRFLKESLGAAAGVSRDGAVHFVCMDWRHLGSVLAVEAVYGQLLNMCVWNKSNAGMGSLYRSRHELVFVYRVGTAPHFNAVELGRHGRNRTNVWDYASVNSLRGNRREDLALHPTVKPVGMVSDAICDVTRHGELVLDTFLGSGTTLVAAERTGRRFAGCDIDPGYVDVALERWSALTGQEPARIITREAP